MFWNKKDKKDMLPDLPADANRMDANLPPANLSNLKTFNLNSPPSPETNKFEKSPPNSFPNFPDYPQKGSSPQIPARNSFEEPSPSQNYQRLPEKPIKTIEIEDWNSRAAEPSITMSQERRIPTKKEISPAAPTATIKPYVPETKKEIFVKLEKFKTGRKSLREIEEKIEEIDSLLKKIRETKLREEQELISWEKDVATIKARLHEVRENIFERIE